MNFYHQLYVILCSIFCVVLVTANLVIQKFVTLHLYLFKIDVSVGILLFPITFLISNLLTEFYGKENANFVTTVALLSSLLVMLIIFISSKLNATNWSLVDNNLFDTVFNAYGIGMFGSITASYISQRVDIHIYSYIKQYTSGNHLWLRNNVSTIIAQAVDTTWMLMILCIFSIVPWTEAFMVGYSSMTFKVIAAIIDTPICYLAHNCIKKYIPI